MTDHPDSGTISLPLDAAELADVLSDHFAEVELGAERKDGYRVIDCSVFRDAAEIDFQHDLEVRLSLIVAPKLDTISLTFFSALRQHVDLVLLLKYLRRQFARGPQYNLAFSGDTVTGVTFDHDLRVVPELPAVALVETVIWFAMFVSLWHDRLNPFLLDETRVSTEPAGLHGDDDEDDDDDEAQIVNIELIDDDDDDDGRYVSGDAEATL